MYGRRGATESLGKKSHTDTRTNTSKYKQEPSCR